MGNYLSSAGDLNGDGAMDIAMALIGDSVSPFVDPICSYYIIYGTQNLFSPEFDLNAIDVINGFKIYSVNGAVSSVAQAVSSIGDVNNDGVDDIVMANSGVNGVGVNTVLYGKRGVIFNNGFEKAKIASF